MDSFQFENSTHFKEEQGISVPLEGESQGIKI